MKNLLNKILHIFLTLALLSSCTQKKPAKVIIKGNIKYSLNNTHNKNKYQATTNNKTNKKTSESATTVTNNVARDVTANNKDNKVATDEKIIISDTNYHKVVSGDTLFSISRNYHINVTNLIKINNLQEPYSIKIGNKLRITNPTPETKLPAKEAAVKIATNTKTEHNDSKNEPTEEDDEDKTPEEKPLARKEIKFTWPIKGKIVSKFGAKAGGLYNDGINIKANRNDPVKAVEDGIVAYVGNELRGYGNLIIIKHYGGWISAYAHLEKFEVKSGDKIKKGALVARVGSTGNVNSPQLYFGIRHGRAAVNPELYLKEEVVPSKANKPPKVVKKLKKNNASK